MISLSNPLVRPADIRAVVGSVVGAAIIAGGSAVPVWATTEELKPVAVAFLGPFLLVLARDFGLTKSDRGAAPPTP